MKKKHRIDIEIRCKISRKIFTNLENVRKHAVVQNVERKKNKHRQFLRHNQKLKPTAHYDSYNVSHFLA